MSNPFLDETNYTSYDTATRNNTIGDNKSIVPEQPRRRGRRGYGTVLIVRLLVYSVLVGISNRGLRTHLEKHNVQLIIPTIMEIEIVD
ncbi:MAG: hypothetical protein DRO62_02005 [Candidatus Altiarchaeales archaeon]|nr:MAG: hypothetical protein DRO62_02005 [Candidatus Altiarchaeales archaeon]